MRWKLAVTLAIVVLGSVAPSVSAITSLNQPLEWWDLDNDGIRNEPAEGDRAFNIKGSGWDQARLDRAASATAAWRNATTWDVTRELPNVVTPASIYVDRASTCGTFGGLGPALTCTAYTQRTVGNPPHTWNDISDTDIYFDPSASWHTGTTQGPVNKYDFQGVLVHELGHGGGLVHPRGVATCPQPWMTMCTPSQGAASDGYHARSLETQDEADMNSQY